MASATSKGLSHLLEGVRRNLRKPFTRVLKLGNLCEAAVDYAISIGYYGDSSLVYSSPVKVFSSRHRTCVSSTRRYERFWGICNR